MREMETIASSSRCHVRTQRFRCLIKALSRDPRLVEEGRGAGTPKPVYYSKRAESARKKKR